MTAVAVRPTGQDAVGVGLLDLVAALGLPRHEFLREALLHGDPRAPATVSQVAAEYGFLHLGHFAALYQQRFGELPAQTLKSAGRH